MNTVFLSIIVSAPQGNRTSKMERKTYFKALAHITVRTGKSEICKVGQQTGNSSRRCTLESGGTIPSLRTSVFALRAFN